jgi:hypothetical protein
VIYRGELDAHESGTVATPIILTRDPAWSTGPAVICGNDVGWALVVNQTGGVTLLTKSGRGSASLASRTAVNNGQRHRLIAEADRKAGTFTLYLDGKPDSYGPGLGADASLADDSDLYVSGTPSGRCLIGALDFMRPARGSLSDSKTTIEELCAWEFSGPFLDDFTGRRRPANGGSAGASMRTRT